MNAYSELYIDDAMCNLGEYLDYMVLDLKYDIDTAYDMLANSKIGHSFECGNPSVIAGISGVEMARKVLNEIKGYWEETDSTQTIDRSSEYWTGWFLAFFQWQKNVSLNYLSFAGIKCSDIQKLYPTLHEADISKAVYVVESLIKENKKESTLKRLRRYAGLSQSELSEKSGVALRMIQLYEQGQNDISKAQVQTVINLAKAIGCEVEELI